MGRNINKLHSVIGDYLRLIDKVKKSSKNELSKTNMNKIQLFRKKIVEISNQLHKGW
jgi:hypothetical protein